MLGFLILIHNEILVILPGTNVKSSRTQNTNILLELYGEVHRCLHIKASILPVNSMPHSSTEYKCKFQGISQAGL